jgi:4,5-dihydroxyphthalate decarboxylase
MNPGDSDQQLITRSARPQQQERICLNAVLADYDRTRRIIDGRVKPQGIDLKVTGLYAGDFCMLPIYEQYDVAEMSFSWYVMARSRGEPVIALPVFPLRMPVLAYILVDRDSPYREPKDLIGKRIGVSHYRLTVNLWLRGILRDHYGFSPEQATWVTCETVEGAGFAIPANIKHVISQGSTAEQLLAGGEVDAIFVPVLPLSFVEGRSKFRRLFQDAQSETHSYFRRTGILPITHTIVMKEALSKRYPWIAESLCRAFNEAQKQCDSYWLADEKHLSMADAVFYLEQQRAAYGTNSWVQGFAPNCHVIETFVRYAHEQGYTTRRLSAEELFPAHTLSL